MKPMAQTTTGRWLMSAIAFVAMRCGVCGLAVGGTGCAGGNASDQRFSACCAGSRAGPVGCGGEWGRDSGERCGRGAEVWGDSALSRGDRFTRGRIIERLVDRALILQQAALEPEDAVTDKELDAQIAMVRKDIPACKQYHCETDEGWKKYLADYGFTVEEFRSRWRQADAAACGSSKCAFGMGSSVKDEEIQEYYEKTMLPEYAKRNVTPPKLDRISRSESKRCCCSSEVGACWMIG